MAPKWRQPREPFWEAERVTAQYLQRRSLDLFLAIIFIVCVAVLFLSHEDPFVRDALCARIGFCPTFANAKAWNKISYDVAVGTLVSLVLYGLVVRLPDHQRRRRLKQSLELHYKNFRQDCIEIMLLVADGSYRGGLPEALLEQDKFREYFKQQVKPNTDRWHEFLNNLEEYHLRKLQTHMEIFRDELIFILNNTDIQKDEAFEFLKRLSAAIYSLKSVTPDYDEVKPLAGFLWNVFAGWDWVEGYRKEDIIKKMIDEI
jgi:hypothetical protein